MPWGGSVGSRSSVVEVGGRGGSEGGAESGGGLRVGPFDSGGGGRATEKGHSVLVWKRGSVCV